MKITFTNRRKKITVILLMTTILAGAFLWKTNADLLPLPVSLSAGWFQCAQGSGNGPQ